jgi:hypothetical protein
MTNPLQAAFKDHLGLVPPVVGGVTATLSPTEGLENLFHSCCGQRGFTSTINSFLGLLSGLLGQFTTFATAFLLDPSQNCLDDMELANTNDCPCPN